MKSSILILVLLAAGAIYFFLSRGDAPIIDLGEGVIIMADGSIRGSYTIEDILSIGTPYECIFRKSDATSQVNGTVRMTENMVRGDFDIEVQTASTNWGDASGDNRAAFASHFISKEGTTYTWTSLQNIGYKMPIVDSALNNASQAEQAQIVGFKDKVDFACTVWNANLTVFELPSGITFSELTGA